MAEAEHGRQVMAWGCRDMSGLAVDIYREEDPARLVIEIHAPLDQLDLGGLAAPATTGQPPGAPPPPS